MGGGHMSPLVVRKGGEGEAEAAGADEPDSILVRVSVPEQDMQVGQGQWRSFHCC